MRVTFCDSCGAPIDARWSEIVLVCRYCGVQNAPGDATAPVPSSVPDDGRARLAVGGRAYLLEGRIARGDSADVFRGRWVRRLGELVVIKVLRALADDDLLRREWNVLRRLTDGATDGSAQFAARLPEPIALGTVRDDRSERTVAVYRWRSGYVHTLADVIDRHRAGVPAPVAVWLLKRLLELLAFGHRVGLVHGAVVPAHVLVHPRDHGATLIGWSAAVRPGDHLPVLSRRWLDHYPAQLQRDRVASATADVAMAARVALLAAGATRFDSPGILPGPVGALVVAAAAGQQNDAWQLCTQLSEASLQALGPPAYNPLSMPGWPPSR